jgi:hypothetical protein
LVKFTLWMRVPMANQQSQHGTPVAMRLTVWYDRVAQRQQPEELCSQLQVWLLGPLCAHQACVIEVEVLLPVLVVSLLVSHIQL